MNIIVKDYESVQPDIWPQNKCRSLWPIFHGPLISRRLFDIWTSYFRIMCQYDPAFDLKINVSHCDLYFMVHWFCLIPWRLFDVWTSYFEIMSQYDPTFDLKINVGLCDLYFMVQWFSLLSWRLRDHYLGSMGTSSIGSMFAWHASSPKFDPHIQHILSWPFSLFHWFKKSSFQLLTKECALSTGKLPRRLAQEQCG